MPPLVAASGYPANEEITHSMRSAASEERAKRIAELRTDLARIKAEVGRMDRSPLDLADVVAGGNGFGSGERDRGIDPRSGEACSGKLPKSNPRLRRREIECALHVFDKASTPSRQKFPRAQCIRSQYLPELALIHALLLERVLEPFRGPTQVERYGRRGAWNNAARPGYVSRTERRMRGDTSPSDRARKA